MFVQEFGTDFLELVTPGYHFVNLQTSETGY
jgi:hypothetical protein